VSGPDVTNVTETVSTNVDPYTTPFGTTMLVADCDHNISRQHHKHCQSTSSIEVHKQSSTTEKMFPAVSNMVTGLRRAVTTVSGQFTAPRTSGLNVRSRTATNTPLMPSSHVAHERGCTSMITPHITCHNRYHQHHHNHHHHHHQKPLSPHTTRYQHRHYHHRRTPCTIDYIIYRSEFRRTEQMRI
jgi:hypothetical protein